jgi:hypothetical protein
MRIFNEFWGDMRGDGMDQARALAAAVDEARQWDRLMALARRP